MSIVTIVPEFNSLKSMESLYSSNSSKISALNRRKSNQRQRDKNPNLVPAVSEVKQRVISARMIRMKQLQNQVGEAHHRIAELAAENRLLKSLHKRQDSALSKYENSNAELPQLLHSHSEEVRTWQTRSRNLHRQNKEMMNNIKQKDTIILTITDQNKHLLQLNRDKHLEERERLAERVKDLEQRLLDKDSDMRMLARRLQLETKSFKTNLSMEQQKYRDLLSKLEAAHFELNRTELCEKRGNRLGKSASNKLKGIKSTTSITYDNGDNEKSMSTVLPPFNDNIELLKKQNESMKNGSSKVNAKVKLFHDEKASDDEELEVDLTRNKIDKSDKALTNGNGSVESNDDLTSVIKNGMNRARHHHQHHHHQQQSSLKPSNIPKPNNKLTPMPQQQLGSTYKKTTSSDDSEFSDEGYHFFNDHANIAQHLMDGDKMTHNNTAHNVRKVNDMLDHKKNIAELELKMKQNSIESHPALHSLNNDTEKKKEDESESGMSSSMSSNNREVIGDQPNLPIAAFDDIPVHSFFATHNDRGDNELDDIEREIRDSMMRRETLLDAYCEDVIDKKSPSHVSAITTSSTVTKIKKLELNNNQSHHYTHQQSNHHGYAHGSIKSGAGGQQSKAFDQKKKSKLLAALKAIDGNGDSIEK
ncbi:unnamed protein product [Diamesa serratosioi]